MIRLDPLKLSNRPSRWDIVLFQKLADKLAQYTHQSRAGVPRALFLLLLASALFVGCATPGQRGDQALESGDFVQALDHYDRAFDSGDKDPERHRRAAKAALQIGDFSAAEKYYSQAMRYGGDEEVARELAELYISTSNYTKAVKVLQNILEVTDEPQDIFNNLGTALMYAGAPLNAESYLLVAQQMDPDDPVPYVNLGVLYERHLKNPRLAYGFYRCFIDLNDDSRQEGRVKARIAALEAQYKGEFPERFHVDCGVAYQPASAPDPDELRREVTDGAAAQGEEPAISEEPRGDDGNNEPDEPIEVAEKDALRREEAKPEEDADAQKGEDEAQPIVIEHLVEDAASAEDSAVDSELLSQADRAFSEKNYREVMRLLEAQPIAQLDPHALSVLGRSALALGEYEKAAGWLSAAVKARPDRKTVDALWSVYEELNDQAGAQQLCRRFAQDKRYRELKQKCDDLVE